MITVQAPDGAPEVGPGDDLAALVAELFDLADGDIVAVTSKWSARPRAGFVPAPGTTRCPPRRGRWSPAGTDHDRPDPARAHPGCHGIDASNVAPGTVVLLPVDPDASARTIRESLLARTGRNVGVLVTDTAGRAVARRARPTSRSAPPRLRVLVDLAGSGRRPWQRAGRDRPGCRRRAGRSGGAHPRASSPLARSPSCAGARTWSCRRRARHGGCGARSPERRRPVRVRRRKPSSGHSAATTRTGRRSARSRTRTSSPARSAPCSRGPWSGRRAGWWSYWVALGRSRDSPSPSAGAPTTHQEATVCGSDPPLRRLCPRQTALDSRRPHRGTQLVAKTAKTDRQAKIDQIRNEAEGAERRRGFVIVGVCVVIALLIVGSAWWVSGRTLEPSGSRISRRAQPR